MKYFIIFCCVFLSPLCGRAQVADIYLSGKLKMETGEEFPYKIIAKDSFGILTGVSYTYDTAVATKVVIRGTIDKEKKKIKFKETEILSSHDVHTQAFMCLLNASLEMTDNVLTGKAKSAEIDNTACTPGVLTFSNASQLQSLFSSHDKYDVEVSMGSARKKQAPKEPEPVVEEKKAEEQQAKITAGTDVSYTWNSDTVVIDVWDGGGFDGDIVSIGFDKKYVLTQYTITPTPKRIKIALPDNQVHTIIIKAENEGSDPPNTANLNLFDGTIKHPVKAFNKKNELALIKVKKD